MAKAPPSVDRLASLIAKYSGKLSSIAGKLGVSRQTAANRIRAAGLEQLAAGERAKAGIPGPRAELADGIPDAELDRAQIRAYGSLNEAAAALGLSRRALYRRRKALGIV